jgi:uncharacterized protein (DUF433 family)
MMILIAGPYRSGTGDDPEKISANVELMESFALPISIKIRLKDEDVMVTATETIPLETDAHGVIRVSNTRVTLDTIVIAFKDGATAEEIAQQYPTVPLADVYYIIGYYLRRRDEVESYLKERKQEADELQVQMEARFNPVGIRERLLARQKSGT